VSAREDRRLTWSGEPNAEEDQVEEAAEAGEACGVRRTRSVVVFASGKLWRERSGRPARLTGGRHTGAESTAAAAGEADEAPPAVEGRRAEEESEEPVDDDAEVCCSGAQRAESGIIRSRGPLA
jgi:hypothetical protein